MRLRIRHETTHRYELAPGWLAQWIRLTPIDTPAQRVLSWRVLDERSDDPVAFADGYGNACHLFTRRDATRVSRIVAEGEVETLAVPALAAPEPLPPRYFLRASELTAPTPEIRALALEARASAGGDAQGELLALAALVNARIVHSPARTDVATRAGAARAGGAGVCQDRAHVFLAAARALEYPARYASGYLEGAAASEAGAMHAWGEVWLGALGWLALDPSSGERTGVAHVRVAVGLDYTEAAPIRGVRRGGAEERLDVRVQIQASQQQQ
ncbi:MAG: transglutaminase domain-containing protein [Myxococcota bacterium]